MKILVHAKSEWIKEFTKHHLVVTKEEGDTSQVCQAYDYIVAN